MRICMVATSFPRHVGDFAGSFVFELSRALVQQGIEVSVLCPHDQTTSSKETLDGVQITRFEYIWPRHAQRLCYGPGMPDNIRHGTFSVRFQLIPYVFMVTLRTFLHRNVDLFHVHWPLPNGFGAYMANLLRRKPFVTTSYGGEVYLARHLKTDWLLRSLMKRSQAIVAISQATGEALSKSMAARTEVKVIPFGVNIDTFQPLKPMLAQRQDGLFRILAVGRLVERKGFEYLVAAMPSVLSCCPDVLLRIVGGGPLESSLAAQIERAGLSRAVKLLGVVPNDQLAVLYRESDVVVLPAVIDAQGNTEGQGLVLLEAMASRTPVIASNVGGIPDMIQPGQNGLLVQPRQSNELSSAIVRLIEDEELRLRIAENGYRMTTECYAWSQIAERYIEVYSTILRNQSSS
jgi:glycosyltransferase involved in cell wall biosynthesis